MEAYEEQLEFIEGGQLPLNYPELKLEDCKDSLYYYNILKKAKDEKEATKGQKDSLAGEPGNKDGSSGCKNLDDMLDNQDKIDQHITWGELTEGMSDIEKEVLKRDIISRLEKIAEDVQKQNGTIPTHLEGLSNRIKKVKETVNWKALFRKFVGSTISSEILINRKRPNKRFEDNPSTKNKFKTSIVIGVDSSGSMNDFSSFRIHHSYLLCAIILLVRRSVNHGNISYHPHVIKGTGRYPRVHSQAVGFTGRRTIYRR